ncbi:FMN-binding domain protein [Oxobacter pfennigii]|uniref:FMN-binding domain protein n=1 Tax=Oxobacter pfennigii TaxID=36849 RepID=A0A0P8Y9K5_9CLOT|nr:FMN-binding protein [Oxobacter pfennigii]KPU43535.1 FMN-binding domain protein [Oxobacter pfennigii]
MKNWLKAINVAVIIAAIFGGIFLRDLNSYRQMIEGITFSKVDIGVVPDGTYNGEYDAGMIYARVSVVVKDGEITTIKLLEHKNGRGAAAEKIINEMVRMQTIDVDAVSGATNSSKVIKKAVDNALPGSIQK